MFSTGLTFSVTIAVVVTASGVYLVTVILPVSFFFRSLALVPPFHIGLLLIEVELVSLFEDLGLKVDCGAIKLSSFIEIVLSTSPTSDAFVVGGCD